MKKRILKLAGLLMTGVMAMSGARAFADYKVPEQDKAWIGNPYMTLAADNPYVRRLNTFAKNAFDAYTKDKSGNLVWMVWGYTAPESELKNNEALKPYVFEAMNAKFAALEQSPVGGWDHQTYLSILFMWSKADPVPEEYEQWKKQYEPSVRKFDAIIASKYAEEYAKFTDDPQYRTDMLINGELMEAAGMACAAAIYGDAHLAEWAKRVVLICSRNINPDGAFDYYGHSGTIDCYTNFEQGWLGWYYQFTKDPVARDLLIKAAKTSIDKLASGVTSSGESPWWKDDFNAGGFMYAPVIVAGISGDARTAAIADFRLGYGQNHIGLYIAAPFYDETIEPMEDWYQDLCRYSTNINGVKLRSGFWNVSMQNKTRAPGAISAIYMPDELYKGQDLVGNLKYANLMLIPLGGGVPSNPYRSDAFFAVAEGQADDYGCIAGEDFIVSGKTWVPSVTSTSHVEPVNESWKSTQIWFADKNGLAGYMAMTAQRKNLSGGLYGVIKTGKTGIVIEEDADFFTQENLRFDVYGENVNRIFQRDAEHFSIVLKDGKPGTYQQGTTVGFGLAVTPDANTPAIAELLSFDDVMEISVWRGETDCIIVYNPTDEAVTYQKALGAVPYYKSSEKQDGTYTQGTWNGKMTLQKNEIAVIFNSRPAIETLDEVSLAASPLP